MADVVFHLGREALLLEARTNVLTKAGYTVISALSVDNALEKLATEQIDVVLLCDSMPMLQRELFARLVHQHLPHVPVVLVSETTIKPMEVYDAIIENKPSQMLKELQRFLAKKKAACADHL